MSKLLLPLLVALALLATSTKSSAVETGTVEHLLQECNARRTAYCPAYIRGFVEGHQVAWFWDKDGICIPEGISTIQAIAIFVRWAERNPDQWHERDWKGVRLSLLESFPCVRPGTP